MNTLKLLKLWFCATLLLSSLASADDIEIYTDYVGDLGSENHNILFSLDTSGSMGGRVATVYSGGDYDPNETYGDSSNSDRVYIYDTNLNFTGESFLKAQSKCSTMNTLFGSDTKYPVYSSTIAQWQQTTDTVVIPGECRSDYVQAKNYNFSGTFTGKNQYRLHYVDISKGQKFHVEVRASRKIKNIQIFTTNDNWTKFETYCQPGGKQTYESCRGTSAYEGHTQLWFYFVSNSKKDTNYDVGIFVDGGQAEVCEPDTEEKRDTNDWAFDLKTDDDLNNIIECEGDAGKHGINDSSGDTYAQDCPHGTVCNSPRYTSNYGSRITYLRPTQMFVPGNFHNYLQEGGEVDDLSSLSKQDGSDYCDNSGTKDVIFIDKDTEIILQCKEKLEVMKTAITNILDTLEGAPINIGLQRFNKNDEGGTIIDAVESIQTNREDFVSKLNALTAGGYTPLQESLWEAYRYYSGQKQDFGYEAGTSSTATDLAAVANGYYKTPITTACQTNNVILLTDGLPKRDTSRASKIAELSGESCSSSTNGDCLDEISGAMNRLDVIGSIDGFNNVRTYTIGFDIDLPILTDTARKGGGENFNASDTRDLALAFQNIIIDILSDSSTFVAPAVSVNAFNELRHRDELYFALFKPNGSPNWNGNVKKYQLINRQIVDSNGTPAVDAATGFFKDTSQSFWSDDIDGQAVELGGSASRLSNERRLYTETPSGLELIDLEFSARLESSSISDSLRNAFSQTSLGNDSYSPTNILDWMLGQDVLNTNGNNSTTDANKFIADALHSKPVVITYGGDSEDPEDVLFYMTNLGTLHAINPADASGTEFWTYWPEEHRDNAGVYMEPGNQYQHEYGLDGEMTFVLKEKEGSTSDDFQLESAQMFFGERRGGSHYYGLDVSNARSTVFGSSSRLDNSYYTPFKVLWKITGALKADGDVTDYDKYNSNISLGFEDLAQTWSKPFHAMLKSGSKEHDVLIFSGGYDPVHDNANYSSANLDDDESEYGNAIYIVDRETGELLLSIGNNDDERNTTKHSESAYIQHSIPSTPAVIDINRDGYIDMIFFVDIAGNVWRADIDSSQSIDKEDFMKVGKIAQLTDPKDNRKFYNSVDVSLSSVDSGSNHLNIVVGSGYRASPRHQEVSNNRLYVLFDDNVTAAELSEDEEGRRYDYFKYSSNDEELYRKVAPYDLLEITYGIDGADYFTARKDSQGNDTDYTINGYYFDFDSGEKLLQSSTTLESIAFFATYIPTGGSNAGACGGGTLGSSRFYAVDLNTGKTYLDDEYIESVRAGLPPDISFVLPGGDVTEDEKCALAPESCETDEHDDSILVLLGPETIDVDVGDFGKATKTYWREEK